MDLPEGNVKRRSLEDHDEKFVGPLAADQTDFYVDSSHATDLKNRRSMGLRTPIHHSQGSGLAQISI